ncbi:isochorismatase family cysteine hydrolase [Stenotrophomonas sp.]|uniref:isochorismatase family cysteine hydrolase n=1 Tax=Stenotrophomonas sp. TaxID=69392 RepID=UPI0028A7C2AE|nr:isochorismatase family cysteine hydrolase [Stenotrophomonas sp.]
MKRRKQRTRSADDDKAALLIIDMMNLFDFDGGVALAKSAFACVPAIARLRRRFDAAAEPVIYINDNFAHWQGEFRDLLAQCNLAGGSSAKIALALAPGESHYYVLKPKHSAFLCTPLSVLLTKLGVRRLVLTGISLDSCIFATALDANMREFDLWVPNDAVGAISRDRKEKGLALIRASLAVDTRGTRAVEGLFPTKQRSS